MGYAKEYPRGARPHISRLPNGRYMCRLVHRNPPGLKRFGDRPLAYALDLKGFGATPYAAFQSWQERNR